MASMMAIVRKDAFQAQLKHFNQQGKPGEIMPWDKYPTRNTLLDGLEGGSLFLVTVRPNDTLWLVAIFEETKVYEIKHKKPYGLEMGLEARGENQTPITDITRLKEKLEFESGNGIRGVSGKLGQELQTPRVLTTKDEKLLRAALPPKKSVAASPVTPKIEDDDELNAFEGEERKYFVTHRKREAKLRAAKIGEVKKKKGKLFCEVPNCGFDFFETYGEVGRDYIQAHHTKPLSTRETPEETKLSDLILVCANCHVMIHRGGTCLSIKKLKIERRSAGFRIPPAYRLQQEARLKAEALARRRAAKKPKDHQENEGGEFCPPELTEAVDADFHPVEVGTPTVRSPKAAKQKKAK